MRTWLFVLALVAGAVLRLLLLDLRPMHTDEAVHAVKFGTLLETGEYRYDKSEYHGPTLYYATLPAAEVSSCRRFAGLQESTLRVVPAVAGIVLILLIALLRDIGGASVTLGALFTAVSPALVFFSRYYVQEMLLVVFTLGFIAAGYHMLATRRALWAAAAGVCAGLMHATKETSLIAFGATGLAIALTGFWCRGRMDPFPGVRGRDLFTFALTACAVSVSLYSSFGTHWPGVRDSVLAYGTYFTRAGARAGHEQPWYYYLELLGWWKRGSGPVWTEAVVVALGVMGIAGSLRRSEETHSRRRLRVFLAFYAALMWIVYSAIPYKTPWSILGAYHGLIIMAGVGTSQVLDRVRRGRLHWPAVAVAAAVVAFLGWESYRASFVMFDDPANPYVYAHPGRDVKTIAEEVTRLASASGVGDSLAVQVVTPGDDYWPLPWYLRSLSRVGWWSALPDDFTPTPVILASPEVEDHLLRAVYGRRPPGEGALYILLFSGPMYLRPGREIRGYVRLDLLERARREKLQ